MKLFSNKGKLLSDFKPHREEAIFGYLQRVAINLVHDHFRHTNAIKRGAQVTDDGSVYLHTLPSNEDPAKAMERKLIIEKVERILNEITGPDAERDRRIFWLRYRQQHTAEEIARLSGTGLTVKGVESVLQRMMKRLREKLIKKDDADAGEDNEGPEKGKSGSNSF